MNPTPSDTDKILAACKLASAASFAQGRYGLQGWFHLPLVMEHSEYGVLTYENGIAKLDALVKAGLLRRATTEEMVGLSSANLYRLVD